MSNSTRLKENSGTCSWSIRRPGRNSNRRSLQVNDIARNRNLPLRSRNTRNSEEGMIRTWRSSFREERNIAQSSAMPPVYEEGDSESSSDEDFCYTVQTRKVNRISINGQTANPYRSTCDKMSAPRREERRIQENKMAQEQRNSRLLPQRQENSRSNSRKGANGRGYLYRGANDPAYQCKGNNPLKGIYNQKKKS